MSNKRALAGLTLLAGSPSPQRHMLSKQAVGVVKSFLVGNEASGACRVPKKGQRLNRSSDCTFQSTGTALIVKGREVARHQGGPMSRTIQIQTGRFGEDKSFRQAANALLAATKAGISLRDRKDAEGDARFLVGKRGRNRVMAPNENLVVEVNKNIRKYANQNAIFKAEQAKRARALENLRKGRAALEAKRAAKARRKRRK